MVLTVRQIVTNKVGFSWLLPLRLQVGLTTAVTLGGRGIGIDDWNKVSELREAPGCHHDQCSGIRWWLHSRDE